MENTTKFDLPDFSKKEKKSKVVKTVEKPVLSRINREIKCVYCEAVKTLNPDQYQKRFDYFGSEDAVSRHFQCQVCETEEKDNPFKFWFIHSPVVNNMVNELRGVFQSFVDQQIDVQTFINRCNSILNGNRIFVPNFDMTVENGLPEGFRINFPFVGNVLIRPLKHWLAEKIVIES